MAQSTFLVKNGQSTFDLCLKSLGGFDEYINFLNSNQVRRSTETPKSVKFDTNNVQNRLFSGINYATKTGLGSLGILDNDGTQILDNDNTPIFDNS